MELIVHKLDGSPTSEKIELPESVFNIEKPNGHAIYLAVVSEETAARQGTHATLNRRLVSGGGRKPYKQKGTGNARQGTSRAPQHRHGGTVFGPQPHEYEKKVNKKVRLLAKRSAYTLRAREQKVVVVEDFAFGAPETKKMAGILKAFALTGRRVLFLTGGQERNLYLSARNIYKLDLQPADQPSVRDIVASEVVVLQKSAVARLQEVYGG
ncbi:MAG: 50S ribosomal protein L4 [bacterium]|jgi:large subunit ribosomal protein L4|nr:50S ribosomal protein L4 [bacterium]